MAGQKQVGPGGYKPSSSTSDNGGQEQARKSNAMAAVAQQDAVLGQINLVYGAHDLSVDVAGLTVLEAQMAFKDVLSVEDDAEAYVNGKLVPNKADIRLQQGDRLEFMKEAGQKG